MRLVVCLGIALLVGCSQTGATTPTAPSPAPVAASRTITVLAGLTRTPLQGVQVSIENGQSGTTDAAGRVTLEGATLDADKTKIRFVKSDFVESVQRANASGEYTLIGPLGDIPLDFIKQFRFQDRDNGPLFGPLNDTIVVYFVETHPLIDGILANVERTCERLVNQLGFRACRGTRERPSGTDGTVLTLQFGLSPPLEVIPPPRPLPPGVLGHQTFTSIGPQADRLEREPSLALSYMVDRFGVTGLQTHSYDGLLGRVRSYPQFTFSRWEETIARLYRLRPLGVTCFPDNACE